MSAPRLSIRQMTDADIGAAALVRVAALEALARSEGRDEYGSRMPRAPLLERHILATDPGGSWLAEIDGLTVGYAQAFVRGDIWYLAQLFVLPHAQSLGAGREVLDRAYVYGTERGARVFAVTSSTSPVAHALYMRHGMYARGLGYRMRGPVAPLMSLDDSAAHIAFGPIANHADAVAALDRDVWGAERGREHARFAQGGFANEQASFVLADGGGVAGYGYVMDDGWIGPIAATAPEMQLQLLRAAAAWLTERGTEHAQCYCLSLNSIMLNAVLGAGWRVNEWSFLLASESFGQFDRYLPSGGLIL